jgi:hypothetical protein
MGCNPWIYSDGGITATTPTAEGTRRAIHINVNTKRPECVVSRRRVISERGRSLPNIPSLSLRNGKNGLLFLSDKGGRNYRQSPTIPLPVSLKNGGALSSYLFAQRKAQVNVARRA